MAGGLNENSVLLANSRWCLLKSIISWLYSLFFSTKLYFYLTAAALWP